MLWSKSEVKIVTFTKEYTVGFKQADCNIPTLSWNLVGLQA